MMDNRINRKSVGFYYLSVERQRKHGAASCDLPSQVSMAKVNVLFKI